MSYSYNTLLALLKIHVFWKCTCLYFCFAFLKVQFPSCGHTGSVLCQLCCCSDSSDPSLASHSQVPPAGAAGGRRNLLCFIFTLNILNLIIGWLSSFWRRKQALLFFMQAPFTEQKWIYQQRHASRGSVAPESRPEQPQLPTSRRWAAPEEQLAVKCTITVANEAVSSQSVSQSDSVFSIWVQTWFCQVL